MTLDYFYGQTGELFSFYRIPKALFQEQRFQSLSTDAKTLYGILLDRMSLSAKNGWLDEQNRVFIIFTIEDVKRSLCCADNKATKLLRELEEFGLIERKRRGLGRPSLVYVKNFSADSSKTRFQNRENHESGGFKSASQDPAKPRCNKTDKNNTEMNETYSSQIVTMHIQSVDQNKAIKTIKHTITELDRSKIEEQKKAVRAGYDMDVLPSDLATYGRDAKALLKELQSQNERMFLVTFLVLNTGKTEQELETNVFQAVSIAQKHNCELCRLDFQQEQGLMSSLPLADCQIEIQRGLTTSSTAIFVPFTTQELFDNGKEALYYGLNALSNNLIMVDRKKLKNPNGLILGTPGSGKSFSAKREICNAFLVTDDDILVCDPESEYRQPHRLF